MSEIKNGRVRHEGALTGQMNLKSDLVALVADGDVTVQGKGQEDGTRVQGLVYTKGSFKAQDSTIVGAVVSARVDGTTELDRVNMIQLPGVTDFEVVVDEKLEEVTKPPSLADRGSYVYGVEYQGVFTPFSKATTLALRALANLLAKMPGEGRGELQVRDGSGAVVTDDVLALRVLDEKSELWGRYLEEVRNDSVERTEIFKLDLNSFLSLDGEIELLFWKSYRQRLEEQAK